MKNFDKEIRVFQGHARPGAQCPRTCIVIDELLPWNPKDIDRAEVIYYDDGRSLYELLKDALPGGTFDRLRLLMMHGPQDEL